MTTTTQTPITAAQARNYAEHRLHLLQHDQRHLNTLCDKGFDYRSEDHIIQMSGAALILTEQTRLWRNACILAARASGQPWATIASSFCLSRQAATTAAAQAEADWRTMSTHPLF